MDSPDSEGSPGEVVYGSSTDEASVAMSAMSDMVQSMASAIYGEFERMIKAYGDPVVEGLMPQLVAVLENWDRTIKEKQDVQLELDLALEDNEQLLNQYEREKQLRRSTEQSSIEIQDSIDEQRKEISSKLEIMEKNYKVLELKSRNYQDQVMRLEEKESEVKKEYDKLHSRYTELFRTHMDYVERTKTLIGPEKVDTPDGGPFSGGESSRSASSSQARARLRSASNDALAAADSGGGFTNPLLAGSGTQNGESAAATVSAPQLPHTREQQQPLGDLRRDAESGLVIADGRSGSSLPRTGLLSRMSMEAASADLVVDELEPEMEGADDATSQLTDSSSSTDEVQTWIDPEKYGSGMTREVENLIKENQELIQMKNALSVVKDDLIGRLDEVTAELELARAEHESLRASESRARARLSELEDDVKKLRDTLAASVKAPADDDDTPSSQRKRFTRVEMARVIMERNQYKERLMELQEAVRWTEMIRASREHSDTGKKKSNIWNFFSNLFATPSKHKRLPAASLHYSAPATHVRPVGDPNRPRRSHEQLGDKAKAYDFLQDDALTDGARRQKEEERKEQYRKVQAHVRRDDSGRVQAYGWSVPNRSQQQAASGGGGSSSGSSSSAGSGASPLTVPVPVYCRPLVSNEDVATKLCCAAAVLPALARTRDGGSVVGSSVFYSPADETEGKVVGSATSGGSGSSSEALREASEQLSPGVAELSLEITEHQMALADAEKSSLRRSSLVWICTATDKATKVVVIDASNPAECLESFIIPGQRVMTIACIPGAAERDYPTTESHGAELATGGPAAGGAQLPEAPAHPLLTSDEDAVAEPRLFFVDAAAATGAAPSASKSESGASTDTSHTASSTTCNSGSAAIAGSGSHHVASSTSASGLPEEEDDERSALASKMVLPTMWLTTESGWLYIYAAGTAVPAATTGQSARCLKSLRLSSCGLCITHAKGKVFVGLGDGKTAIFHRTSDGRWCTDDYHVLDFADRGTAVRCTTTVANSSVWLGFKNCVYVVDAESLQVAAKIDAHPRKESQVRLLSWAGGDGVWVSIRLDSTLRLFHAYTHERLQDIDVEPYVDKMLGAGKLGFSFSRVTALDMSCGRLWIGTGNGVIISLPLADANSKDLDGRGGGPRLVPGTQAAAMPGGAVRVYCDSKTERVTPASYVPYCCSSLAQLSFHGHRDAVKFFVTVSSSNTRSSLVMSGGEGYIDFRVGDDDDNNGRASTDTSSSASTTEVPAKMWSHLIVWEVTTTGASGSSSVGGR